MKILIFMCAFILFSGLNANEFTETRMLQLDAAGIASFDIEAGAGYMIIKGNETGNTIEVKAMITVEDLDRDDFDSFMKRYINLSLEKHGNQALLISEIEHHSFFNFSDNECKIDLEITIPYKMNIKIDDGSGFIVLEKVQGTAEIDDGSGSIDIREIIGDININDGSGEMTVSTISGNVDIEDGSGEIDLNHVTGNIDVDDGSGSITITAINGNVTVRDGSGSILIEDVDKDVTIEEAGSGGLTINNIKGRVQRYDD